MSAVRHLPLLATLSGVGLSLLSVAVSPSLRASLVKYTGVSAPNGTWRFVAIFLAIINLKNLPFVWHIRLFRALIYHLYLQPKTLPPTALFEPLIISSRTPLTETDYNLHKSNSTYFTDLDIARTHHVTALLRKGIQGSSDFMVEETSFVADTVKAPETGNTEALLPPGASFNIALGGVSCHFKREIPPYEKFEIWTRLLTWDRKWLYLVSHLVRAGVVEPANGYSLQPGRRVKNNTLNTLEAKERKEKLKGAIFASSISKYVVKKARLTIPPELVLQRSDMMPPKPEGAASATSSTPVTPPEAMDGDAKPNVLEESLFPLDNTEGNAWTWERVQAERMKGLRLAEKFGALDELYDEFTGGWEGKAMGHFATLV